MRINDITLSDENLSNEKKMTPSEPSETRPLRLVVDNTRPPATMAKGKKRKRAKAEIKNLSLKIQMAIAAYKDEHKLTTDDEVAFKCGLSASQLSYWQSDPPKRLDGVTFWALTDFARALDVSLDWLATGAIDRTTLKKLGA